MDLTLIGYLKAANKYEMLNMHDVLKFKVINYIGFEENPLKESRSIVAEYANGHDYIIHTCDSALKARNIADSLNRLMMQTTSEGPRPTVVVSPQTDIPIIHASQLKPQG